ncbi:hypothetical protein HII31_10365 [Pseudocercospora fuligena]|uniref:Uncharacterized protein n=1 Tax=Pseudocercospora fuligena TaxID=685502 RepID=A0A8H6RDZ8_9PEZI|nr:hypothetical protein HII31_10365 [Pseudocercospora fuligena]
MATAPDLMPKRHLLLLPQELLDIILDLAYPAEDEKRFVDRAKFEKQERERRRHNPSTFAPKDFIYKVDQWMVSKAFFESASRAWVTNQHFHDYAFPGPYSDVFARVYLARSTESGSVLAQYCAKLSVTYIPDIGNFNGLPSLKYLTLVVDHEIFRSSEPAFAWEVSLSQEQLETVSQQSGLAGLPKLKQIRLVADEVKYAKTKRQQEQWSDNVTALEILLQEHQRSKVAQEPGTKMLESKSQLLEMLGRLDQNVSRGSTPRVEPMLLRPTTSFTAPLSGEALRARMSAFVSGGAKKLAQLVSQPSGEASRAAADTDVVRVERHEETPVGEHTNGDGSVDGAASTLSVGTKTGGTFEDLEDDDNSVSSEELDAANWIETETEEEALHETSSGMKRDAREFYTPFPKRRALVKYDMPVDGTPARPFMDSASRPALEVERQALPSAGNTAPLLGATQGATLSGEITAFLSGGMIKISLAEGEMPERQRMPQNDGIERPEEGSEAEWITEDEEEFGGSSNMVSTSIQTGEKSKVPEDSTGIQPTVGEDVITSNDAFGSIAGHLKEVADLTKAHISSLDARIKDLNQAIKLHEARLSSQSTQSSSEPYQAEIVTTKLKKLEQGVSSLLSSRTEPKPAAKPEHEFSVLIAMCSLMCFLICLYILLQMALSTDYVAFRFGNFELVMRRA